MANSFILPLIAIIIPFLLFILAWTLNTRHIKDQEKCSPFECGFDPNNTARIPFSLRFFLLAVIFLMFDIEVVLLLPLPKTFQSLHSNICLIPILMFLFILLIGLFHEWREGSLEWH